MSKLEGSLILVLCLLGLSNPLSQYRDPVKGFSIEEIQDNFPEKTAAGGYRKVPNRERQTSQYPATTLTAKEILKKSSESAKEYPASNKETEEQKPNLNTLSEHASKELQTRGYVTTKSSHQSLDVNFNDIKDVFQEDSRIDKLPEYYRDNFRDKFLCLPCQCHFTYNRSIVALCQSTITEINTVLSNNTQQITISYSPVRVFQATDFLQYHSLQNLSVSNNKYMYTIANNSYNLEVLAVKRLDLHNNKKLRHIMDRSFKIFANLLSLNLSNNDIKQINKLTFEGLRNLKFLNLARNKFSVLEAGTFDHFQRLEVLDLSGNSVYLYFTAGVFSNLTALHTLYINGNLKNATSYPNAEIARLVNLTSLSIDGISKDVILGPEIKMLQSLITLHVGYSRKKECSINNIVQSFLINVPYLETVRFSNCPLNDVDINVYKNVPNLTSLEFISTYPYDIFKALDGLRGLKNSSLKSLSLVRLIPDKCPFICLYGRDSKYLTSLELEVIDLSDNRIGFMDQKFIHDLPRTLKTLVIRGNELIEPALLTDKLFFLTNLETLDLSSFTHPVSNSGVSQDQDSIGYLVAHVNYEEVNVTHITDQLEDLNSSSSEEKSNEGCMYENIEHGIPLCAEQSDNRRDIIDASNINHHNYLRPACKSLTTVSMNANKLRTLLASRFLEINLNDTFDNIKGHQYTNLEYIDFSYSALASLTNKTVIPPWIKAVNFNGNNFKRIRPNVFHHNNSVTYLSLNNNVLGNTFAKSRQMIFSELNNNLLYLDISSNMIYELPANLFEGLHNLTVLIMRENKLGLLNTNFSTTPQLEYLDLRKNSITRISKSSRDDLDIIATNHPLYVELTSNPLRCTCEGLEVLHWIWASNIHFVSKNLLKCDRGDDNFEYVGNIEERVTTLQRQCAGKSLIIVLCVASLVVVCFLVVLGIMYRFRWQLRYIRHIALSRLVGFKPRECTSSAYKFDAFIVYSDMSRQFVVDDCLQELEVKRGHKLCVDDRDFMPGTLSVSAIVSAIQNSRKTVLILSPDFYDEEFSEYSVKMALMEEIYQKRPVLYLCVYRPLPDDEMSKSYDLLMLMKRNNYMEFPPETETCEEVRQSCWDQLSGEIGFSVTKERAESADSKSS